MVYHTTKTSKLDRFKNVQIDVIYYYNTEIVEKRHSPSFYIVILV